MESALRKSGVRLIEGTLTEQLVGDNTDAGIISFEHALEKVQNKLSLPEYCDSQNIEDLEKGDVKLWDCDIGLVNSVNQEQYLKKLTLLKQNKNYFPIATIASMDDGRTEGKRIIINNNGESNEPTLPLNAICQVLQLRLKNNTVEDCNEASFAVHSSTKLPFNHMEFVSKEISPLSSLKNLTFHNQLKNSNKYTLPSKSNCPLKQLTLHYYHHPSKINEFSSKPHHSALLTSEDYKCDDRFLQEKDVHIKNVSNCSNNCSSLSSKSSFVGSRDEKQLIVDNSLIIEKGCSSPFICFSDCRNFSIPTVEHVPSGAGDLLELDIDKALKKYETVSNDSKDAEVQVDIAEPSIVHPCNCLRYHKCSHFEGLENEKCIERRQIAALDLHTLNLLPKISRSIESNIFNSMRNKSCINKGVALNLEYNRGRNPFCVSRETSSEIHSDGIASKESNRDVMQHISESKVGNCSPVALLCNSAAPKDNFSSGVLTKYSCAEGFEYSKDVDKNETYQGKQNDRRGMMNDREAIPDKKECLLPMAKDGFESKRIHLEDGKADSLCFKHDYYSLYNITSRHKQELFSDVTCNDVASLNDDHVECKQVQFHTLQEPNFEEFITKNVDQNVPDLESDLKSFVKAQKHEILGADLADKMKRYRKRAL